MEELPKNQLAGVYRMLPIEAIFPNAWNPNVLEGEGLNRLAEEIQAVGFNSPIQVVQREPTHGFDEEFVIIGGEHRWQACKYLGWEEIPAIVLHDSVWSDIDIQKFGTVRLNVLSGKLNPEKFFSLFDDLAERYPVEDMQQLLAFTDEKLYKQLTKDLIRDLAGSDLPEFVKEEFKEKVDKSDQTMEGITRILNEIFTTYGDTVRYNFLYFDYGGKKHLEVQCDKGLWKQVNELAKISANNRVSMRDMLSDMIGTWDTSRLDGLTKVEEEKG